MYFFIIFYFNTDHRSFISYSLPEIELQINVAFAKRIANNSPSLVTQSINTLETLTFFSSHFLTSAESKLLNTSPCLYFGSITIKVNIPLK